MVRIINPGPEDYHVHSMNFSDGMNTVDEIVRFAGQIGLKKIAITDHSDATLKHFGVPMPWSRTAVHTKWKNIHNQVEVIFGVEGDLLDEKGNVCTTINNKPSDFLILSAHSTSYKGRPEKLTQAYIVALRTHKPAMIGHIYAKPLAKYIDIAAVVSEANKLGIPLEFNTSYLPGISEWNDEEKMMLMLKMADRIYVNSDAHTLNCLQNNRAEGFKFLKKYGIDKP